MIQGQSRMQFVSTVTTKKVSTTGKETYTGEISVAQTATMSWITYQAGGC